MTYTPDNINLYPASDPPDLLPVALAKVNSNFAAIAQEFTTNSVEGVQDTVGAMVESNTETAISLTYDDENGKINASVTFGTAANTACEGNDARLSDARTPTTHTHAEADITDIGPYASLESDMVPTDELGTGTADSGSFLRGDRTWQPVSVGYPSTWYWADQSFMAKPVSVAADRYKFLTPNVVQSDVGGASLSLSSQATLDLSLEATWDTVSGTDYRTASNRAGKDFYIYLCQPGSGTAPVVKVSANSTTPSGYTAANSRKVGGFPCLCVAAGTLSGHPANGYVAGDIIPIGVWDLKFRAANGNNAGMAYVAPLDTWIDIYFASGTGASTASANGGTISDTRTWLDFVDDGAAVKKRMLRDYEFQIAAAGSNEETNIAGSADPGTTGGHSDTASRRMISNYFLEDCCGALWQWLDEQSFQPGSGTAGWKDVVGGTKGQIYLVADNADVKLLAGGFWGAGAFCGSRSRNALHYRWNAAAYFGCRFAARSITK